VGEHALLILCGNQTQTRLKNPRSQNRGPPSHPAGNLTVHGVTKEVTFQGIATFNRNGTIAGRAETTFNFATFGLNKPTIARLMSVDDKITLELVYRTKRS
jgi:polyisoprenoid-binding protein YceI